MTASVDGENNSNGKKIGEKKNSCIPYFDALWFCYSPVHQMKQYYVYGNVDDCTGHWSKLMDCLKKKTTMFKDTVPADPMAGKHPVWELRTREEAEMFWKEQFSEAVGSKCAENEKSTLI